LRVLGRDGRVGGSDVFAEDVLMAVLVFGNVDVEDKGAVVLLAVEYQRRIGIQANQHGILLPVAPALSHGLGGETVLILSAVKTWIHEMRTRSEV
jgi:hypothetical protein